ncbi:MAG: glycosyltransferase [Halobacteriovoraceae bacterium]|nr:glycosyltransferase [Halobacteriovoraceae bacterium]MBT5093413.1 glycosyltransferase [Halobacteriovoraceae bacterium]
MKVVLLHDWLTGFRGGERVLEVFCEMFPKAPLYTLIHKPGSTSDLIEDRKIVTSFLNGIPGIHKHYRKFLPLFPLAAQRLRIIEEADLVLSSSHCVIKGVKKPIGSTHISYVHSPMRYIYDQFETYFGPHAPFYQRWGAKLFRNYLTEWDLKSNQNVDHMIANAHFVQSRIKEYYQMDSDVIHPFVDLKDFNQSRALTEAKDNYYVMLTAFAPNKRVDLAIRAFNKMGLTLKIIGSGQQEEELRKMAGENIEFLGNLSREAVIDCLCKAKAMIFPGVEDFGITPLEALASGTPVIAFKEGGVLETLNTNVAHFFENATDSCLVSAVEEFEKKEFDRSLLISRANDFSRDSFKKNIENLIERELKK